MQSALSKIKSRITRSLFDRLGTSAKAAIIQEICRQHEFRLVTPYSRRHLRLIPPNDGVILFLMNRREYHEEQEINFVARLLSPDSVSIDVGANVGFWTVVLGDVVRAGTGRVFAFEPTPATYSDLLANMALNGLKECHVHAYPLGLADRQSQLDLHCYEVPSASCGWNTFGQPQSRDATGKILATRRVRVPVTTLDAWWAETGYPACQFLKLDVEGYESLVLQGAAAFLARHRELEDFLVLCEVNSVALRSAGSGNSELWDLIRSSGYQPYRFHWESPSPPELSALEQDAFNRIQSENIFLTPLDSQLGRRISQIRWD